MPAEVACEHDNIIIRPAGVSDKESIKRIYYCMVGPPAGQESVWERLFQAGGLLVAERDHDVVAFGGIDVRSTEQLKWLYVLPEFQQTGIGRRLLAELEAIGWSAGVTALRVHAAPGAEVFYARSGYVRVDPSEQVNHDHEGVEMIKRRV